MEVFNFSRDNNIEHKHNSKLPNSIRLIITGPSGSGKTQLLLSLIIKHLKWDKLYVISPTIDDQNCYDVLKELNDNIKTAMEISEESIEFIYNIDDTPSILDIDSEISNLVVFDDVLMENQTNAIRLFTRGRHKNVDIIYATQRYCQIPKIIRDNCNMICVFVNTDRFTTDNIYRAWCAGDMRLDEYRELINRARGNPFGFITISLHDSTNRYRIGLG